MAFQSLQQFIELLETENELIRIRQYFSTDLEITEVTDRIIKSGVNKALLFEQNGSKFPLLINALGSEKRMCLALGISSLEQVGGDIERWLTLLAASKEGWVAKLKLWPLFKELKTVFPKVSKKKAPCQEIVQHEPDISQLPILTCWPHDGGKFITFPVVHSKDLSKGTRNIGMYRMQVYDKKTTGMHWHLHKNASRHFQEYKDKNMKMPVAVTLGGDPVYTYCATAPLPDHIDEYMFAGFLRKKAVEMVPCVSIDLEVPADVDFVLEGYVDPNEDLRLEGPFGDHTGFYSLADYYPVFHIQCITHKKNAIYPSTIVGIPPQEDAWIGKATERFFLKPIQMTVAPEVLDICMPFEGVFHNIVVVKIKKSYPGQAEKVMSALWGAGQMMFNKYLVVVDETVDIQSSAGIMEAWTRNFSPESSLFFSQGPLDVLDHAAPQFVKGGKLGINLTEKSTQAAGPISIDGEILLRQHPEIFAFNRLGLPYGIACISLKRPESGNVFDWMQELLKKDPGLGDGIQTWVIFDVDITHLDASALIWYAANQTDAVRDCRFIKSGKSVLVIDAGRKTAAEGFQRQWPQVVLSDAATIDSVNKKWSSAWDLAPIDSPSDTYRELSPGDGAVWIS